MNIHESLRHLQESWTKPRQEVRAFNCLMGTFGKLKDKFYPETRGMPEKELIGDLGSRRLFEPQWDKPCDFKLGGKYDVSDKVFSMASDGTIYQISIEKYDTYYEDGDFLAPCYCIQVMPEDSCCGIALDLYLPLATGKEMHPSNIQKFKASNALMLEGISYCSGDENEDQLESPENVLLDIIAKDQVLSLRVADWLFSGLLGSKEMEVYKNADIWPT